MPKIASIFLAIGQKYSAQVLDDLIIHECCIDFWNLKSTHEIDHNKDVLCSSVRFLVSSFNFQFSKRRKKKKKLYIYKKGQNVL